MRFGAADEDCGTMVRRSDDVGETQPLLSEDLWRKDLSELSTIKINELGVEEWGNLVRKVLDFFFDTLVGEDISLRSRVISRTTQPAVLAYATRFNDPRFLRAIAFNPAIPQSVLDFLVCFSVEAGIREKIMGWVKSYFSSDDGIKKREGEPIGWETTFLREIAELSGLSQKPLVGESLKVLLDDLFCRFGVELSFKKHVRSFMEDPSAAPLIRSYLRSRNSVARVALTEADFALMLKRAKSPDLSRKEFDELMSVRFFPAIEALSQNDFLPTEWLQEIAIKHSPIRVVNTPKSKVPVWFNDPHLMRVFCRLCEVLKVQVPVGEMSYGEVFDSNDFTQHLQINLYHLRLLINIYFVLRDGGALAFDEILDAFSQQSDAIKRPTFVLTCLLSYSPVNGGPEKREVSRQILRDYLCPPDKGL